MSTHRDHTGRRDCTHPRARHEHGTLAAWRDDKCSCFDCRVACANAARAYRSGGTWSDGTLVPMRGTRRRLQALAAIGVGRAELADRLGVDPRMITFLRSEQQSVRVETAAAVTALYDELWNATRTGHASECARTQAAKRGWLPPLGWDSIDDDPEPPTGEPCDLDEVAVERAVYGHHVPPLNRAERLEAIRVMHRRGLDDSDIGRRMGKTPAAICQDRRRYLATT